MEDIVETLTFEKRDWPTVRTSKLKLIKEIKSAERRLFRLFSDTMNDLFTSWTFMRALVSRWRREKYRGGQGRNAAGLNLLIIEDSCSSMYHASKRLELPINPQAKILGKMQFVLSIVSFFAPIFPFLFLLSRVIEQKGEGPLCRPEKTIGIKIGIVALLYQWLINDRKSFCFNKDSFESCDLWIFIVEMIS